MCDLWSDEAKKSSVPEGMEEYLKEQYPHIRFSPYLTSLAREIAGEEKDPLEIARRIYDYITTKVQYSYMKEYSLITDIPQYCARNLRGDCGVQALLFITLCRICGIPAKWQSGLYANPAYVGPHDWAMFYVEPYGWLYADPSFGGSAYASGDEQRRGSSISVIWRPTGWWQIMLFGRILLLKKSLCPLTHMTIRPVRSSLRKKALLPMR